MQLRDDDALGAVDDERAVVGHERQFAQVHFLFAHVLDGLLGAAGFLVEHHEAHFDAQRRRVGQSAQLAFLDVEYRLAQAIAHVFERRVAGIAGNGEHAVEGGVQADFVALGFRDIRLQESPVRIQLDRQQIRRAENARTLAEVLTNALLFGERISHVMHALPFQALTRRINGVEATPPIVLAARAIHQHQNQRRSRRLPLNSRQPSNCAYRQ